MYTGQITFAALGSQDVTHFERRAQDGCSKDEGKAPQDSEGANVSPPCIVAVEPCSPKSVYRLANKVCLSPLRGDAAANNSPA